MRPTCLRPARESFGQAAPCLAGLGCLCTPAQSSDNAAFQREQTGIAALGVAKAKAAPHTSQETAQDKDLGGWAVRVADAALHCDHGRQGERGGLPAIPGGRNIPGVSKNRRVLQEILQAREAHLGCHKAHARDQGADVRAGTVATAVGPKGVQGLKQEVKDIPERGLAN